MPPPKSASAPPFTKADDVSLRKVHRLLLLKVVPLFKGEWKRIWEREANIKFDFSAPLIPRHLVWCYPAVSHDDTDWYIITA